jgi:GNAT superfamily N-acetyltransferase
VGRVTAPEPLTASHETGGFACGVPSLDDWLKKQALKNEVSGASRTYAVCESGSRNVVGFYALATGSAARKQAPGRISRRQMPEPVPVAVLGRLAVDERWHGCGIGSGLLKDAVIRTMAAARHVGIRALLVHALNEQAKAFYLERGFIASPIEPMTLMLSLAQTAA